MDPVQAARSKETNDLAFAAYAAMKGMRVLRGREWRRRGGSAEYAFQFDDPDNRWEQLHVDFVNSECAAYDASVRTMKKLCKYAPAEENGS